MKGRDGDVELFALRGRRKRPATAEELDTARAYHRQGAGPEGAVGVLFIHGFTVTPANFRAWAEALADQGYTVSVPLLPGHGARPEALEGVLWTDWLDAVISEYDQLRERCEKVFVVGISLGGALAFHLAARREGIEKLFALAPAVFPVPLLELGVKVIVPALRRLGVTRWTHVAGDVKRKEGFELGYGSTPTVGLEQLYACMLAAQQILSSVTTETLVFQGQVDHEVPAGKAPELVARLGSGRKALLWLDDSFHEIPRDNDAPRVLRRIVKEIKGGGS